MAAYREIHTLFSMPLPDGIQKKTDDVLHAASITLAETMIMDGLLLHDSDWELGVSKINSAVAGFKKGNILAGSLHKALWRCATAMTKGTTIAEA